jgi:hypothetical protein
MGKKFSMGAWCHNSGTLLIGEGCRDKVSPLLASPPIWKLPVFMMLGVLGKEGALSSAGTR